ncbi:hypothetical protein VSU19_01965 [Verrucomicrobiales bacterium BCK34]|nr:hypothetical protein [Verrucomicrobiales bacterium BCK34]
MTETESPKLPRKNLLTWLWNPFAIIAGGPALTSGILIILATGYLASHTHTHFDGVLDTHVGLRAPLWFFLAEGILNWLCLFIVLLIGGLLVAKRRSFRFIDLLGTQALARWPFLITTLVTFLPGFKSFNAKLLTIVNQGKITFPSAPASEIITFVFVTFLMIVVTVWFVALAWKSFRISCDVRGWKAITVFAIGIIIAEVLSKFAFLFVLLPML